MNALKPLLIGVALTGAITNTYADENKDALAIEYLQLSKTKEAVDRTIEIYSEQLSNKNPTLDKEQLKAHFNTFIGWEVLKEPTIKLVANTFSAEELKSINSFYKTENGRSWAEKSPQIAAGVSKITGTNIQKALQSLQQPK